MQWQKRRVIKRILGEKRKYIYIYIKQSKGNNFRNRQVDREVGRGKEAGKQIARKSRRETEKKETVSDLKI